MTRTHNQAVLAATHAQAAVNKARQGPTPSPESQVMAALKEAIMSRCNFLAQLAMQGQRASAEYRESDAQLSRWLAAWMLNR